MEWYQDSKACLSVSKQLINEISDMSDKTTHQEYLIPFMKVKIKNCLENCRSPLDYVSRYIFDEYCKIEYLEREQKKPVKKRRLNPKIYYPIRKTSDSLTSEVNKLYFPLKSQNPNIINIFNKGQFFYSQKEPFLYHLNELTNENKHRNLTYHSKEKTAHVKSGSLGGALFKNVTFIDNATDIVYENVKIDFVNPTKYDKNFDYDVSFEYFFKDLNISVIPSLNTIYEGVLDIVESLYIELNKEDI